MSLKNTSILLSVSVILGSGACERDSKVAELPVVVETAFKNDIQRVDVSENGYSPARIEATAGRPLTLVFERITEKGCGQEVVFPEHKIRKPLPLNTKVSVTIMPKHDKDITFTCGMGMYRGSIIATN